MLIKNTQNAKIISRVKICPQSYPQAIQNFAYQNLAFKKYFMTKKMLAKIRQHKGERV